jgi:hypothetical protein
MPYLIASIPYFDVLVRREYTRDMADGHGDYLEGKAIAVECRRGDSLWFQVMLKEPYAGALFGLPIEALVTKPPQVEPANGTKTIQPWDCFSSDFGVEEIEILRRTRATVFHDKVDAEYQFTLCFTGSDVADDPAQRKLLHVVKREDGLIGAYPNNRLQFHDRALWGDMTETPDFTTLQREFRAEGMNRIDAVAYGAPAIATAQVKGAARSEHNGAAQPA